MELPITTLLAASMGILLIILAMRVVDARRASNIHLGDGGDKTLMRRMRGQANFVEYTPLGIVLVGLLEIQGANDLILAALSVLLALARVAHAYSMAFTDHNVPGRMFGATGTLISLSLLCVLALWMVVSRL